MKKCYWILFLAFTFLFANAQEISSTKKIPIPFRKGNLWGFCTEEGKVVVKPYINKILRFSYDTYQKGCARFLVEVNNKQFVINENNQNETPKGVVFDSVAINSQKEVAFLRVYLHQKVGVCNAGKWIIPCNYDSIETTSNHSYKVQQNGFYGIINKDGKIIVPVQYNTIYEISSPKEEKAKWVAKSNNLKEFFYDTKVISNSEGYFYSDAIMESIERTISKDKALTLEKKYKAIYDSIAIDSTSNYAIIYKANKKGILNIQTDTVIWDCVYDAITSLGSFNRFKAKKDHKLYILYPQSDKECKELPFDDFYFDAKKKLYIGEKGNLKGIVFTHAVPDIAPLYQDILYSFNFRTWEGNYFSVYAVVTANGKTGFIGENGIEYFQD